MHVLQLCGFFENSMYIHTFRHLDGGEELRRQAANGARLAAPVLQGIDRASKALLVARRPRLLLTWPPASTPLYTISPACGARGHRHSGAMMQEAEDVSRMQQPIVSCLLSQACTACCQASQLRTNVFESSPHVWLYSRETGRMIYPRGRMRVSVPSSNGMPQLHITFCLPAGRHRTKAVHGVRACHGTQVLPSNNYRGYRRCATPRNGDASKTCLRVIYSRER